MTIKSTRSTVGLCLLLVAFSQTGAKADLPGKKVQQQLYHAITQNQIAEIQTLLGQGGDPNARVAPAKEDAWMLQNRPGDDPAPPLIVMACRFGNTETKAIELLLAKGANVNITDTNGVTPLMSASELGWDPSVILLLAHGAKVKAKDKNGETALMYAMGNRSLGAAALLLQKGAAINDADKAGMTPLMYAITRAAHDPVMLFGEDEIKKAKEAKERYQELIAFLIAHHADVNAKDMAGNTPLKLARPQGQPEILRMLRQAGAKD